MHSLSQTAFIIANRITNTGLHASRQTNRYRRSYGKVDIRGQPCTQIDKLAESRVRPANKRRRIQTDRQTNIHILKPTDMCRAIDTGRRITMQ